MEKEDVESGFEITASTLDILLGAFGAVGPLSGLNAVRKLIEQKRTNRTIRNLKAFLKEANKSTSEQRENFKKRMGDDYQEFSDSLLKALEELDKEKKAEILGKLQLAMLEEKLQPIELMKFAKVLELIYISTLEFFLTKDSSSFASNARGMEAQYYHELMGLGLVASEYEIKNDNRYRLTTGSEKPIVEQKYKITNLGNLFLDIYNYNARQAGYVERKERLEKMHQNEVKKKEKQHHSQ